MKLSTPEDNDSQCITSYSVVFALQNANISCLISTIPMARLFIILAACLAAGMALNETAELKGE